MSVMLFQTFLMNSKNLGYLISYPSNNDLTIKQVSENRY